jgi:hypothetical protein
MALAATTPAGPVNVDERSCSVESRSHVNCISSSCKAAAVTNPLMSLPEKVRCMGVAAIMALI